MEFPRRLPMKVRVTAVFVAVGAIWGSAWIPTASLSQTLPGLIAGALRFGLAALVLSIAAVLIRSWPLGKKRTPVLKLLGPSVVLGITMLGLPYALTWWAADRVSPGMVALCFGLMPLLVLFSEDEKSIGAIPAMALGIGGVAMMVDPGLSFRVQQAAGVAALLGAVGLGGFSLAYVRKLYGQRRLLDSDLLSFSAIQLGVASVFLAAMLAGTGQLSGFHWEGRAALPLALLVVVVSGGTLPMLYWLLGRITASQAATLQWAATLVAVVEAAWQVGVRLGLEGWAGAALILACTSQLFFTAHGKTMAPVTLEITKHTLPYSKASDIKRKSE